METAFCVPGQGRRLVPERDAKVAILLCRNARRNLSGYFCGTRYVYLPLACDTLKIEVWLRHRAGMQIRTGEQERTNMPLIVAIDGPAGVGKSTVARRVAGELDFTYLDTGAMYRSVAWKVACLKSGIPDPESLARTAASLSIQFSPVDSEGNQRVIVDNQDVTNAIRTNEISQLTSSISAVPEVRRVVVEQQRMLGRSALRGIVLEGRDIGTVVFPEANIKVFLTASAEERARRRTQELEARGTPVPFETVLQEQRERDRRDSTRADSPLVAAHDAVQINTDGLSIDCVVEQILSLCSTKMPHY